ncbi:hypothetical protein DL95DRAFT_508823 [Leptodontidium sp. 2 PMI_412]|nr:hypothetical protein DL95DRAFT_508823 [Leptodontidium sp. 2 PMI_412]
MCTLGSTSPQYLLQKKSVCQTVLIVATSFGIAALLSYLRELIHGYQTCKTRTRRVHLVWQLQSLDIGVAAESLLNDALDEDTLDDSYILDISIYVNAPAIVKVPFGKRAAIYPGTADIEGFLQDEKSILPLEARKILIPGVSGTSELRDELRALVRPHLDHGVRLQELEFQPE